MRVLHETLKLLQLTVIFMAQRPNIAMLIVRVKFTGILPERSSWKFDQIQLSADGCWEMKM